MKNTNAHAPLRRAAAAALTLAMSLVLPTLARAQARPRLATSESAPSRQAPPVQVSHANAEEVEAIVSGFGSMSRAEFAAWLAGVQPEAPTAAETDESVSLIRQDLERARLRVVEGGDEQYRLAERARPVLELFGRGQVRFIVIEHDEPIIRSSAGMCVTISTGMLRLVGDSDAKLSALVAHELAHEATWRECLRAQQSGDFARARRFELQCDAVAAYALLLVGSRPQALGEILFAVLTSSPEMAALNDGTGTHPSLATRLLLNRQLARLIRRAPQAADYAALTRR